ncbi:MAG: MFS transporter [Reyranella sp.]|uniref:MFS transporter n=1 Tax=Reyranella sp. TaxID=1929291 RepID=UPI001AD58A59|nr:MFS transporter [Reyranella sp.]MBN9090621.1 MFS transporter [Reyranella sp.]
MSSRSYWTAVWCGFLVLTIGLGVRQSFGIFLKPVSAELHVGRELFSFGTALSMLLMGFFAPFSGRLCDRFGSAITIAGGGAVYVLGMIVTASMHNGFMLILGNVLVGVGLSAATFGPVLGVILRLAPPAKAALAVGICSAGGSFGQFFIVPLASVLQGYFGDWRPTMWALTALAVVMMLLPIGLNDSKEIAAARKARGGSQTSGQALAEAFSQRSYVLLVVGYFVCGFHVAFVGGHLPAYISDKGIGLSLFGINLSPAELGGWSIGMVGLFNIAGSILWSSMGAKYQRKNLLALLYLLRSAVFLIFILLPLSAASVLAFAAALGFLWLGTVPLTTSLVGVMFGPVHLTMLNGFVFLGHQVGSFFGGWGGGKLFDLQGNYDMMWWISIALGIISALMHWPIVEKPVPRPQVALRPA